MRYAIGLDVGGTKIEGVLANEKGKILKKIRVPTEGDKGKQTVLNNILRVIEDLRAKDVIGVGVGVPVAVNKKTNKLIFGGNLKCIEGINLKEFLNKKTRLPVIVKNDSHCFALAEHKFGAGKKSNNMIGIIVGTGIGSGLILDGKVYSGSRGYSGEFGHAVLNPLQNTWVDVEMECSGRHIVRKYLEAGGRIQNPNPAKIFHSTEPVAKKVMDNVLDNLTRAIAFTITLLDLDIVVLGGGVSNLPFYDNLNKRMNSYLYPALKNKVKVVKNKLGDSAGVLGAAALVFQN